MKLLFISLSIGLYATNLFTIGHWPFSFSQKSLLPQSRMPPKQKITFADAPADSDTAGIRGETIVEFLSQIKICRAPLHLGEVIYANAAEEPPSVEIPVEFLDLHSELDESDDGSIDVAKIAKATKTLRELCADRELRHKKNLETFLLRSLENRAAMSAAPGITAATETPQIVSRLERPVENDVEADEFVFAYDASKPNFSEKEKREMEALVKEAPSFPRMHELQRKIYEHITAFTSRQAATEFDTFVEIFQIAGDGISDDSGAMGLNTNNAALESNTIPFFLSQSTGGSSLRIRAKQDTVSTRREPFRADSEQADIAKSFLKLVHKGDSDDLPISRALI